MLRTLHQPETFSSTRLAVEVGAIETRVHGEPLPAMSSVQTASLGARIYNRTSGMPTSTRPTPEPLEKPTSSMFPS